MIIIGHFTNSQSMHYKEYLMIIITMPISIKLCIILNFENDQKTYSFHLFDNKIYFFQKIYTSTII